MVTRVVNLRRPSLRSGSRPQALCSLTDAFRNCTVDHGASRYLENPGQVLGRDALTRQRRAGTARASEGWMGAMGKVVNAPAEETLDPDNWSDVEGLSRQIIGDAVDYLR